MHANPICAFHRDLDVTLADFQREFVLSIFPGGSEISKSEYFDNYDLPCPIRVEVQRRDGRRETVVLRSPRGGSVEAEADLLRFLGGSGLPVPKLLAGPAPTPSGGSMILLSLLPGIDLQKFSMGSPDRLEASKRILLGGISRLSALTDPLSEGLDGRGIPRRTLREQFEVAADGASDWAGVPAFRSASEALRPILASIDTPLVFTNGDYQPGNFLTDGHMVTGFLDFEGACFQDPLIGFAKYPIYDLHPLNKGGLIEYMLKTFHYTKHDFAPRLALGCLTILRKEIAAHESPSDDPSYREHVLALLSDSVELTTGRRPG
jgi:aminoglycoside phosphotransferase